MTKGYVKSETYIVLPSGLEISLGKYNRYKYRKEVFADEEIEQYITIHKMEFEDE